MTIRASRAVSQTVAALAISIGAISTAAADPVDWFGGATIASLANCPTGSLDQHVNRVLTARFLPAGIGTNGTKSSIAFFNQHYAQGYMLEGNFTTVLKVVTAQTVARFPAAAGYPVKVAVLEQTPANILDTTPMVTMKVKVTGFSGFPSNNNCTAIINATLFRP